jgi:hypothetical protein
MSKDMRRFCARGWIPGHAAQQHSGNPRRVGGLVFSVFYKTLCNQ